MPTIKQDDAIMLHIFWRDSEDLTRWSDWREFKANNPDAAKVLEDAVQRYRKAFQAVHTTIDRLTEPCG